MFFFVLVQGASSTLGRGAGRTTADVPDGPRGRVSTLPPCPPGSSSFVLGVYKSPDLHPRRGDWTSTGRSGNTSVLVRHPLTRLSGMGPAVLRGTVDERTCGRGDGEGPRLSLGVPSGACLGTGPTAPTRSRERSPLHPGVTWGRGRHQSPSEGSEAHKCKGVLYRGVFSTFIKELQP